MADLPTRCIDPVMKCCQECTWGYREYLAGCCFESGCTLGFDEGRPEDEPTEDEIRQFEKEMRRSECQ